MSGRTLEPASSCIPAIGSGLSLEVPSPKSRYDLWKRTLEQYAAEHTPELLLKCVQLLPPEAAASFHADWIFSRAVRQGVLSKENGFHLAAEGIRNGNSALAIKLIASGILDPNGRDENGNTLLHMACRAKDKELVGRLLVAGAKILSDSGGITPVSIASKLEDPEIVQGLLVAAWKQGDVETVWTIFANRFVHPSALEGHPCPNRNDPVGRQLLKKACIHGDGELAWSLMVNRLADPVDFHKLSISYPKTMAQLLLSQDGDAIEDLFGSSRLRIACMCKVDQAAIRKILALDKDKINVQDDMGVTPFHLLMSQGHLASALDFIDAGADVDIQDHAGLTPLAVLADRFSSFDEIPPRIVSLYRERGVDVQDILALKRLAQIWGLEGFVKLGNLVFCLDGDSGTALSLLSSYAQDFLSRPHPLELSSADSASVIESLRCMPESMEKDPEALAQEIRDGKTVVLPGTYLEQHVATILAMVNGKYYLLKCGRGDIATRQGVAVYEIGNPENLAKAIAQLQRRKEHDGMGFFNSGIDEELDLEFVHASLQKEPKRVKSPWASVETIAHGLFLLKACEKTAAAATTPGEAFQQAADPARAVYKQFTTYARERSYAELPPRLQTTFGIVKQIRAKAPKRPGLSKVLAHVEAPWIFKGSQEGNIGSYPVEKARQAHAKLQETREKGVSFNSEKITGEISGGACSVMSLDMLATYFALKQQYLMGSSPNRELFAQKLHEAAERYAGVSEDWRALQAAFNTIEVSREEGVALARSKVQSLASYHGFRIDHASRELDISCLSETELDREMQSLPDGAYFIRMIKPEENEKMEAYGHSLVYIKEGGRGFFYDPNYGLRDLSKDRHAEILAMNFAQNVADWKLTRATFYRLSPRC